MVEVVKHLESVSQWKKAVDDLRARKKRRNLSSITAEPKNVKYMITEKSIFTLEIPNGLIKCVLVQFHIILHQRRSSPVK
jgi:hypothetical protein